MNARLKERPSFPTNPDSPFPDKYDIEGERAALADLIEAPEPDVNDPRYPRLVELEDRERMLKQMQAAHAQRNGANREVPDAEAVKSRNVGALVSEDDDVMLIHTLEASRLFIGRAMEPGKHGYGVSGGKKVGAALRAVWYLSGEDNPYADYCLIHATNRILDLRQQLTQASKGNVARLEALRQQGMLYSVLKSAAPMAVTLGFKSPYGYSVMGLINDFDYAVRTVKTLVRKDLIGGDEGYDRIYSMTRAARSIFEQVVYWQRQLMREQVRPLSRRDWLPTADANAKKRIAYLTQTLGELPREVFTGQIRPRHSKLRLDLKPEELRLLNDVPLTVDDRELVTAGLV
ncbi:MAG TPA: TIGR03761 family integrating conjugative element protein [Burkholderiaceae bacterium]|nr:TIGR03761 family integrating conjugative element protein [Burkholderiaceae bacterium]